MKKILLFFSFFIISFYVSADTTDLILKALRGHPKELTDSQARHAYLSGMEYTVLASEGGADEISAKSFAPIPLVQTWFVKKKKSVIWYDKGWHQKHDVVFREDREVGRFINFFIVSLFVILFADPFVARFLFRNNLKSKSGGDIKSEIQSYYRNRIRKRILLFRQEILFPILALVTLLIITKGRPDLFMFLTISWWLFVISLIAYVVRRRITRKAYRDACKKHFPEGLYQI